MTSTTPASTTVEDLLDERDIVAAAIRYTWALDTHDWAMLDTVFASDATAYLTRPKLLEGRPAIVERVTTALSPLDDSQHLVGNHEVAITRGSDGAPDTATHRCYLHAQHIRRAAAIDGRSPHYVVAGRYEDRFERRAEGWRIVHRELVTMWTDGNSEVVTGGPR
ncbi:MAG: nuclear transport factor 2 family protein [Ilumatobacter sp.]|jgi:hypothetical protein|uniref:nuclear transport factor 2 family protein n=1 Tax=Ilumatobacter sp. TaxID=1967498 RepID=UPI00391C3639